MGDIPAKTNRVLKIILFAFLVIVFRVWHLGIVQREEKLEEAQKPQQRTILLRADRGSICDRFHTPLALNRISYNAAVYYAQIAQIPVVSWKTDEKGERVRTYPRKEYIKSLSSELGGLLGLDPSRLEDLIHSKASLFPHAPFIVKMGLSEEEHYRLKLMETQWAGVHAEIGSERYYPLGKTACELIGTMGAISQKEYASLAEEASLLQESIALYEQGIESSLPKGFRSFEEVYRRVNELKERAYTLNDLIGKTGVEKQYEEDLRGFFGKKTFEVDQKGFFLRELPGGKPAVPGKQLVLSVSAELQQFAEMLLTQEEKIRDGRSLGIDPADKVRKSQKQPWIKGGAIVALDPNTGEVLAFASHPRFDPNDFIPSSNPELREKKQAQVSRWLESDSFIASVWDGKELLSRERGSGKNWTQENRELNWDFYLDLILPPESPLKTFFSKFDDLKSAIQIQEDLETLLYFSKASDARAFMDALFPDPKKPNEGIRLVIPEAVLAQKRLETALSFIPSNADKLFAVDLLRMVVYSPAFSDALMAKMGSMKLSAYRSLSQTFHRLEENVRQETKERFHQREFAAWREENQKSFLLEKRKKEKEIKTYAHPYIDYLDQKEKELFCAYWEQERIGTLIAAIGREQKLSGICAQLGPELAGEFLKTFRSFSQLDRPLLMNYKSLKEKDQTEKNLAAAFYPHGGFGFSRSYAFQSTSAQGSIFKLIVGYEGLRQDRCQLTIIDEFTKDQNVAFLPNGVPYPRFYKGGRLPKSSSNRIGKIDLLGAIETSSNPFFSLLAGDYFSDPEDLARAAKLFGYGEKTGIELPGEARGKIPADLKTNRTGLYSTAIGQHTLLNTPLQTAVAMAAIANGGKILKPKIALETVGLSPDRQPLGVFDSPEYFAKEELNQIGIPFPLFTAVQPRVPSKGSKEEPTEIKRLLSLPSSIRSTLLEGMDRSIWSAKGNARATTIKHLIGNPVLMRDYLTLQHQMVGKTSTAEILFNPNMNPSSPALMYKHIWFGALSFTPAQLAKNRWDHPELVVVVFLRYGDAGKEAAPLAAQMIHKWREIKQKHERKGE